MMLWSSEAFLKASDSLHKSWQETNTYQTRYKLMLDENNRPITDIKKYIRENGISESFFEFYRVNKDGFYEEDLKGFPSRLLSPGNRNKNILGAKSILRQVIGLLVSAPKDSADAFQLVIEALQVTHQDWLDMNPWAKGVRPDHINGLIPDLALTNASGPYKLFLENMNPKDAYHQLVKRAFETHIENQQKKRISEFANSKIDSVYLNLIAEKGAKVMIDENLEHFFDSKIPVKKIRQSIGETASMPENEAYFADILGNEIKASLRYNGKIRLKAPSTVPGSGSKVFLVIDEGGSVIGALKIQHKDAGGLDELVSTLAVSKFVSENRSGVNVVNVVKYGLLSDSNYFSVIEPAKNRDLDGWIKAAQDSKAEFAIIQNAAQITAQLHNHNRNASASKETLEVFKGNSLYEVRKLNNFRGSAEIEAGTLAMGISIGLFSQVKEKIADATKGYERSLESYLQFFRPTTIHGDLHGGNVFFNSVSKESTFIDYSTLTWTIAVRGQPGTGDPANDLGRMLGHFLVEDIKTNKFGQSTVTRVRDFYREYLKDSKIVAGSSEENILRQSLLFYLHRYFAIQASDLKGLKFNSQVLAQPQLMHKLYEVWLDLDLLFSVQSGKNKNAA